MMEATRAMTPRRTRATLAATTRRSVAAACATVAATALLGAATVHAQSKTGTSLGQFLLIEPSARAAAMGNAGVSLFNGLQGVYYNPAAIGNLQKREATFTHSGWIAGMSYDYAAAAVPFGLSDGVAYASLTSLGSGPIEVRTVEQPQGTGERYSVNDLAFTLGYGKQMSYRFSAGGQLAFVQETIWHSTASAFAFSAGTIYRISESGLHIGASFSNFGTRGRYDGRDLRITYDGDPDRYGDNGQLPGSVFTESYALPSLFRVGAHLPVQLSQGATLRLAMDALHPSDNSESVNAGAELSVRDRVAVRAGYQGLFQTDRETGLTAGVGLKGDTDFLSYQLDYTWADQGRLGSVHRVSVGTTF